LLFLRFCLSLSPIPISNHTPSIRALAKLCGVSPATVSRVLNNRPGEVGSATRERVLDAVRQYQYRPPRSTRQAGPVGDRPTLTLGIVSGKRGSDLLAPGYHRSIVEGLLYATDYFQENTLLFAGHLFRTDPQQSIRTYCDGRCDGLLILTAGIQNPLIRAVRECGIPLVLIGDTGDDATVPFASVDNVAAARAAVEGLMALGHTRIALLRGPETLRSAQQRSVGYHVAMTAAGLPAIESPFFEVPTDAGQWAVERRNGAPSERPTAFFCFNDVFALVTREAPEALGLRIPNDVSLVGFDDLIGLGPEDFLTTVRQPYRDISLRAVEALVAQVRGDGGVPQRNTLPGEIVWRASTGPAPA
jgi:LacI family transcriptional regulator